MRFDFESGDLQGWQVMEGKFDRLICDREMCRNTPGVKLNKQGRFFLSTIELGDGNFDDGMTGVLESPVFVRRGARMSFLVGGGEHADTYVALCTEDGAEVRRARGAFTEMMTPVAWEAPELVGRRPGSNTPERGLIIGHRPDQPAPGRDLPPRAASNRQRPRSFSPWCGLNRMEIALHRLFMNYSG